MGEKSERKRKNEEKEKENCELGNNCLVAKSVEENVPFKRHSWFPPVVVSKSRILS